MADGGHPGERTAGGRGLPLHEDGLLRAFGIAVLEVTADGIARIVVFGDPGLVTLFGLPLVP